MDRVEIGQRLRDIRVGAGATLRDVAKMIGRSKQAISLWESGEREPRVGDVARYLRALSSPWAALDEPRSRATARDPRD